jgi:phage gp29-like protein
MTQAKKPAKPEMNQIATIDRDPTKFTFGNVLTNEDATLISRGQGKGLKIYDEIERDTHAYADLQKRKLKVVSRAWTVTPASDSALDQRAGEIVEAQLKGVNFDQLTLDLLDATLKGFAVGELMWEIRGAELVAARVIARDQRRFVFDKDHKPRLLTRANLMNGEELPERKFIVHSFGAKDDSPYGLGLGYRIFWPVFFKGRGITFWLTAIDKFGSPTALGKYPSGAKKSEQDTLLAALQAIAREVGVIVPEGMEIELIEAKRAGTFDTYEKLCRYMDEQISECVLGGSITTTPKATGMGSGVAETQNECRKEIARADADLLSGTLAETLVRWIVEYNTPGAALPKVWRDFEDPKDLVQRSEVDKTLYEMGYEPESIDYINETYGGKWVKKTPPSGTPGAQSGVVPAPNGAAATQFAEASAPLPDPVAGETDQLAAAGAPTFDAILAAIGREVDSAPDLVTLQRRLTAMYGALDTKALANLMAAAFALAELKGMADA